MITLVKRVAILLVVVALVALLGLIVYRRLGSDPISWLTVIIGAAAAIVFYLQVLKDW